jgi:hypothetical protein
VLEYQARRHANAHHDDAFQIVSYQRISYLTYFTFYFIIRRHAFYRLYHSRCTLKYFTSTYLDLSDCHPTLRYDIRSSIFTTDTYSIPLGNNNIERLPSNAETYSIPLALTSCTPQGLVQQPNAYYFRVPVQSSQGGVPIILRTPRTILLESQ